VERLIFADCDLSYSPERLDMILDMIIRLNTRGIPSSALWAPLPKLLPLLPKIKKAGFHSKFTISLQTTAEAALKTCRRKCLSFDKIKDVISEILKHFPDAEADIILGLPGETPESFRKGLFDIFSLGVRTLKVFRLFVPSCTEYYKRREYFGLEIRNDSSFLVKSTPDFTEQQIDAATLFAENFRALARILRPEDIPLYHEWGLDMTAAAEGIASLGEQHADSRSYEGKGDDYAEADIAMLMRYIDDFCGYPPEKAEMLKQYIFVRYKAGHIEAHDSSSGEEPAGESATPRVIPRFTVIKTSPKVRRMIDVIDIGVPHDMHSSDSMTVFAVLSAATGKAAFTVCADAELYRRFLDTAVLSHSLQAIVDSFETEAKANAIAIAARLAETGVIRRELFEDFARAPRFILSVLKQADINLLKAWGIDLTELTLIKPALDTNTFAPDHTGPASDALRFISERYNADDEVLKRLEEYLDIKEDMRALEAVEREKRTTGKSRHDRKLVGGYIEKTVSAGTLEMLNISESLVETNDGKAIVFAIYNPTRDEAIALSGKDNRFFKRLLDITIAKSSVEDVVASFSGVEAEKARIVLMRMAEAGFF